MLRSGLRLVKIIVTSKWGLHWLGLCLEILRLHANTLIHLIHHHILLLSQLSISKIVFPINTDIGLLRNHVRQFNIRSLLLVQEMHCNHKHCFIKLVLSHWVYQVPYRVAYALIQFCLFKYILHLATMNKTCILFVKHSKYLLILHFIFFLQEPW